MKRAVFYSALIHIILLYSLYWLKVPRSGVEQTPIKISIYTHKVRGTNLPVSSGLQRFIPNSNMEYSRKPLDGVAEKWRANEERGEGNLFKKKEHKYFSYYERIREQMDPLWAAKVIELSRKRRTEKRVDAGRMTVLLLLVDVTGTIVDVLLVEGSGDARLDQIAVKLMRGQVFPNVPATLIEADGFGRMVWYFRT